MSNFSSNWNKGEKQYSGSDSLSDRLRNSVRSPEPLKPKLDLATRQIQIQIAKLAAKSDRLSEKDKLLFDKVVTYVQKHDTQHANMLANELSEIRKMGKLVTQAKLAFEQIELRINTIRDLGDVAASLSPAVGIIKGIAPGLNNVLPELKAKSERYPACSAEYSSTPDSSATARSTLKQRTMKRIRYWPKQELLQSGAYRTGSPTYLLLSRKATTKRKESNSHDDLTHYCSVFTSFLVP